jgi:anti-sigma regulatory factor (Ser/Thr protein kinase)
VAGNDDVSQAAFAVRLPCDDTAAGHARRLVAQFLTARAALPPERVGDAVLVVHELVVNGLVHGEPDDHDEIEVSGRITGDELVISVLDHGTDGTVAAEPFTPDRTAGRGLSMVAALSRRWTVDRSSGTRVSAWLAL